MNIDRKELEKHFPLNVPESLSDLDISLRLFRDKDMECWYAPLGSINKAARIAIFGITPGWNQMRIAYKVAIKSNSMSNPIREMSRIAFAGSMRANLISMLNNLGINRYYGAKTFEELFGTDNLAYSSVLKYPVFYKGRNYNGHTPRLLSNKLLLDILESILVPELKKLEDCLIIPLGNAAEEGIAYVSKKAGLGEEQVLYGFPHPSGANAHRKSQFENNKDMLTTKISRWFGNRK